jgi:hypothetical protein
MEKLQHSRGRILAGSHQRAKFKNRSSESRDIEDRETCCSISLALSDKKSVHTVVRRDGFMLWLPDFCKIKSQWSFEKPWSVVEWRSISECKLWSTEVWGYGGVEAGLGARVWRCARAPSYARTYLTGKPSAEGRKDGGSFRKDRMCCIIAPRPHSHLPIACTHNPSTSALHAKSYLAKT